MESDNNLSEPSGVHSVEMCVYSLLSTDLDGIYQSINELRESQALLVLLLRKCRDSLKNENDILYEGEDLKASCLKTKGLEKRMDVLSHKLQSLRERSARLVNENMHEV